MTLRLVYPAPHAEPDLLDLYDHPAYLRAGFVLSTDGAIAVQGRSAALSGPADKRVFAALRAVADVILVGAGTARAEDYGPVRLAPAAQEWRQEHGRTAVPLLAVVSRSLDLDPGSRLFGTPRPLIVTAGSSTSAARHGLSEVADVLVAGDADVDLPAALAELRERHGPRILCEGGPHLLAEAARAGLLTELCLTHSPLLAGAGPALFPDALTPPLRLRLEHLLEEDGSLLSRYSVL